MEERDFHPLLSRDELNLLADVARSTDPQISKLRDAIWRLSKLKVSEGFFPDYAAIIDEGPSKAFACKLVEKFPVGHGRLTWIGSSQPEAHCLLIEKKLECEPWDVFLLARPCIRIAKEVSLETRHRLTDHAHLCVTVSNLPVRYDESSQMFITSGSKAHHHLWSGPLVDFLADEEGYGIHRQPTVLDTPREPVSGIFASGIYTKELGAAMREKLGVFLPSSTVVSVDLNYQIRNDETVLLDSGLVMARYSAKQFPI